MTRTIERSISVFFHSTGRFQHRIAATALTAVITVLLFGGARPGYCGDTTRDVAQLPAAESTKAISLDGLWRCAPDPFGVGRKLGYDKPGDDKGWREASVPGTIEDLGAKFINWNSYCWYHRRVTIPADWAGKRIMLAGEGVYDRATIWIDGEKAGEVDLPFLHWEVPVHAPAGKEIHIAIEIDNRIKPDRAPGRLIAWRPLAGILRPLRLEARSWTTLDLAALATAGDGHLTAAVEIKRAGDKAPAADRVQWRVETLDGKKLGGGEAKADKQTARIQSRIAGARPWSPESPSLYRLVFKLLDERGTVIDRMDRRFGFRHIAVEKGKLCLDGRPLQLAGADMHEDRPEAPFRWHENTRADLKRMIACGANCVRLTCYPHDPRTLDDCDELGLLVISEMPLFGPTGGDIQKRRIAHTRAQLTSVIHRDLHHASVLLWIVSCETGDAGPGGPANQGMVKLAHQLDPSRPASHISCSWEKDPAFKNDDVVCINAYPSWLMHTGEYPKEDPAQWWRRHLTALAAACPGKPIIISEFGHPAIAGGIAGNCDEVTQAAAIAAEAKGFDNPALCGTIIWCWADHLWPLGHGFVGGLSEAPFGLLTRDRHPKPALAEAEKVWRQRRSLAGEGNQGK